MVAQNSNFYIPQKFSVGGTGNVPPTLCLRPANISANTAANVERTGKPRSVFSKRDAVTGQRAGNTHKTHARMELR